MHPSPVGSSRIHLQELLEKKKGIDLQVLKRLFDFFIFHSGEFYHQFHREKRCDQFRRLLKFL